MRGLLLPFLVGLAAACSVDSAPLVAGDIVVTEPRPGAETSAAYLTLTNTTRDAIRIDRVTSPQFDAVELHESIIADGIARMRALDAVSIPPAGHLVFERGGKHLMLKSPVGAVESVTLVFHSGDTPLLSVSAMVGD